MTWLEREREFDEMEPSGPLGALQKMGGQARLAGLVRDIALRPLPSDIEIQRTFWWRVLTSTTEPHQPAGTSGSRPVTFEALARAARVSRSWLYTQPDIRADIERLRDSTQRAPSPAIPAAQRASDASLLSRLQAALEHNRKLAEENQRLRRQLAHALGDQRTSARSSQTTSRSQAAAGRTSITIGAR